MPKVRQRDPNDKIKTKGKKRSGGRKNKASHSRQVQKAIKQKVKQREARQASNESAVSTIEQEALDTATGAARLTGRATEVVYDKVIPQRSAGEAPSSSGEQTAVPAETGQQPSPQPVEQRRKLAVQEYTNSQYKTGSTAHVSESVRTVPQMTAANQPKVKAPADYGTQTMPKGREPASPSVKLDAVDMGRRYAVQSRMETVPKGIGNHVNGDTAAHTDTAPSSGVVPKIRPAEAHQAENLPKGRPVDPVSVNDHPVEMGRKAAIQSAVKRQAEGYQNAPVQEAPRNTYSGKETDIPVGSEIKPKTKPVEDRGAKLTPKTKETAALTVEDTAVEQGRRLAIQTYAEKQAEKAATHNTVSYSQAPAEPVHIERVETPSLAANNAVELPAKRPELTAEVKKGVHSRSKERVVPRQKPKSAPKTRSKVDNISPKMVRPEKVSRTNPVLTSSQKATEMGRRKFMKETQKQLALQAQKTAKAAGNIIKKASAAILKAIQATVSMLAGIFGGVGLAVILMAVLLIGAILASPFGILFSNEPANGAIPLSSAVAQISMEYATRLNELQEGDYETITIEGEPPEWIEVIAVFACHVAGGDDGVDVMVLDAEKVDKLRTVFWDMCVITTEEETEAWTGPTTPTDTSTEPTVNLTITIEAKTADDMRLFYSFSESQNDALTELLAENEMLNSLIGDLDVSQGDALEVLNGIPSDVSETRKAVVRQALTLVGKVNYFWGGKSLVIGWDNRWGQPMEVWAAGSPSTGTIRPYGLDCSGFVDWVFYNVSGGSYVIGHGGGVATQHVYCQDISWDQALPGDLIFYPDDSHAGIVGGWDDSGNMLVIHCASGRNNVVVTGSSGFSTIGRPYYYGE